MNDTRLIGLDSLHARPAAPAGPNDPERTDPRLRPSTTLSRSQTRRLGVLFGRRLKITIESTFSTVRLRTKVTKGPGSRAAGLAMAFTLIEAAAPERTSEPEHGEPIWAIPGHQDDGVVALEELAEAIREDRGRGYFELVVEVVEQPPHRVEVSGLGTANDGLAGIGHLVHSSDGPHG